VRFTYLKKRYSPIGLDLGSTAVRGVQLSATRHEWRVHSALEVPLAGDSSALASASESPAPVGPGSPVPPVPDSPSPTSPEGSPDGSPAPPPEEPDTLEPLHDALDQLLAEGLFTGNAVAVHCPAEKLDFRPIRMPPGTEQLPPEDLREALRLQTADHLSFPPDQAVMDYFPLTPTAPDGSMTFMVTTADGAWIRRRLQLLRAHGLRCVAITPLPVVLAVLSEAVRPATAPADDQVPPGASTDTPETPPDGLWPVIDLGHQRSTLVVHTMQGPVFCREFPVGGWHMTDALAQRLMVDIAQAERLKRAYGLGIANRLLRYDTVAAATSGGVSTHPSNTSAETSTSPMETPAVTGTLAAVSTGTDVALNRETTLALDPSHVGGTSRHDREIGKVVAIVMETLLTEWVEGVTRSLNYVIHENQSLRFQPIRLLGGAARTPGLERFLHEAFEWPVESLVHPLVREIEAQWLGTADRPGNWMVALGLALGTENTT